MNIIVKALIIIACFIASILFAYIFLVGIKNEVLNTPNCEKEEYQES